MGNYGLAVDAGPVEDEPASSGAVRRKQGWLRSQLPDQRSKDEREGHQDRQRRERVAVLNRDPPVQAGKERGRRRGEDHERHQERLPPRPLRMSDATGVPKEQERSAGPLQGDEKRRAEVGHRVSPSVRSGCVSSPARETSPRTRRERKRRTRPTDRSRSDQAGRGPARERKRAGASPGSDPADIRRSAAARPITESVAGTASR